MFFTLIFYIVLNLDASAEDIYSDIGELEYRVKQKVEEECRDKCSESERVLREMEKLKLECGRHAEFWKDGYIVSLFTESFITAIVIIGFIHGGDGLRNVLLGVFSIDAFIGLPIFVWWFQRKYRMFKKKVEELDRDIRMFKMMKAIKE